MAAAAQALAFPELVLGRYRPLKPLGSGGSGSVWLARDEQKIAELVAFDDQDAHRGLGL